MNLPQILKNTLENSSILTDIICLLFYGSARNKEDFHEHSDYDFHIVIKEYNLGNLTILKSILSKFKYLDISIQSLAEIQNQEKQIIFQNGTQGIYFINILTNAEVLIGKNIYLETGFLNLSKDLVLDSLKSKLREYNWRLRRYLLVDKDTASFKKYSIRILRDLLCIQKPCEISIIATYSHRKVINEFIDLYYNELKMEQIKVLKQVEYLDKITSQMVNFEEIYLLIHEFVIKNI